MTTRRKKTRAVKKHPTRPREDHKKPMAGLAGRAFDCRTGIGSACPRQHDPEAERIIRDADRPRTNLRLAWKEFKPVGACDRQPVKIIGLARE